MTPRPIFILTLLLAIAPRVHGASVTQVKGTRTLLELSGLETAQPGDELFAEDAAGKKRALLKVTQVKGARAIADVVKGKPQVGHTVVLRSVGSSISREVRDADIRDGGAGGNEGPDLSASEYRKRLKKSYSGSSWGLMGEFMQTAMTANFTVNPGASQRNESVQMKGSSFGVLGYYDYPLSPMFQIRGIGGLEQLNAAGSTDLPSCANGTSTACDFKVTYLSVHGQAKFVFLTQGDWRYWVNGGYGFLIAMSKSSSVLAEGNITTNQIYSFGGGIDIPVTPKNYVPVSLEYGLFPRTSSVEASVLFLRVGYGWNL